MKQLVVATAMCVVLFGCAQKHSDMRSMQAQLDKAVNAHDIDAAMMLFTDDPAVNDPMGEVHKGKDATRAWFSNMMPGFRVESENVRQSGDTVMWESTVWSDELAKSGVNPVGTRTMAVLSGGKIKYFNAVLDGKTQGKMRFAKFFNEVIQKKNVNAIDDFISEDFVDHQPLPPNVPKGREGVKLYFKMMEDAFPDLTVTPIAYLADGDKVLAFTRWEGTNTGKFMGKPATNRKVSYQVMDIITLKNGKATEHWGVDDQAGMMRQMMGK